MGFFRKYRTAILLAGSIAFAAGVLSIAYLTSVVTSRFNGRRWNLPSRIYSDVETLSPGLELAPDALVEKLGRLYYQPVDAVPERAGQYRVRKNAVDIWLHSFSDIGRRFEGFPVRIEFAAGKIRSIATPDGDSVSSVVLEPELLGSVFDKKLEDRTLVRLADVSRPLIDAIITREDRDFYRHGGVSGRRILGALVNDVRRGAAAQGGSTLT
ncbi:MAG TPA: transglycosylase domain-containing protein, partial [Thermoanaerobaculia bacterium]|nr:transglycosylase domain-containing protein [Thermoanaerobaculia bacterium]